MTNYRAACRKLIVAFGADPERLAAALDLAVRLEVERRADAVKVAAPEAGLRAVAAPGTHAHAPVASSGHPAPSEGRGTAGTDPTVAEAVRAALAGGPASGSAVARQIGARKADVLAALHGLEVQGEVARAGRAFRLILHASLPVAATPEPEPREPAEPMGQVEREPREPIAEASTDAPVSGPPPGWTPLSHLAARFDPAKVESWDTGPAIAFDELDAAVAVKHMEQAVLHNSGDFDDLVLLAEAVLAEEEVA